MTSAKGSDISVSKLSNDVETPTKTGETSIKNQKKPVKQADRVPYLSLFRYADRKDLILMFVGTVAGVANGAVIPLFSVVFGNLIDVFGGQSLDFVSTVNKYCLYFVYLAIATFIASYGEVTFWMWTGSRQANRVRAMYLKSILRQDVAYFDKDTTTGKLLLGLNEETIAYQAGISEKVGTFIHNLFTFIIGMGIAFWKGWSMTLIILAMVPILGVVGAAIAVMGSKLQKSANEAYAQANQISQQALGNIRTVAAFNREEKVVDTYSNALDWPLKAGIKQGLMQGLILGAANGVWFMSYGAAMYFGATRVADHTYTGGEVMNVIFAAIIGGFALGQAAPSLSYFRSACTSGAVLFAMISQKPTIDPDAPGLELKEVKGNISLENVQFSYPARDDKIIFQNFSLEIEAGTTVALVGESGSGKSTVIQLIQRFYDPDFGCIKLDGHDLRTLQLRWLRSNMGLVSQEPALFATTIRQNISYGNPSATEEEIVAAAKAANAHKFISGLPDGYKTHVGEKGVQMSGGQKQRIAIARAILRNPKVLLLDEATSALDSESEKVVQEALDNIMVGRTTIVVAHRLSTIINADKIAVVKNGGIVEIGSHEELTKDPQGAYSTLISAQQAVYDASTSGDFDRKHGPTDEMVIEAARRASLDVEHADGEIEGKKEGAVADIESGKPKKKKSSVGYIRLFKLNKPEWPYLIVGAISSAALGFTMPGFALALSSIINVFFYQPNTPSCPGSDAGQCVINGGRTWALVFTGIGAGCLIFGTLQGYSFGFVGQHLARRLRVMLLKAALRQEIGWFDKKENSSGAIIGRLSADTVSVRGAVGDQIGLLLQNLVTVIASYFIAFSASWSMTLVVTATLPVLAIATVIQNKFFLGFTNEADKLYSEANQTAAEALGSIRTISSFGLQDQICNLYVSGMQGPEKQVRKRANTAGAGFGFSQFVMMAVYALAFWFGGQEVSKGHISFEDMLRAFFAILLAAFGLAQAQMAFPDMGKAKAAITRVFGIIDRVPSIDSDSLSGDKPEPVQGRIELRNVTFVYPSRPDVIVFKNFDLLVEAGKSLALVGESGSGKSTVVGLTERFYDPVAGSVLLDNHDLRTLNVHWLRSQIGLVNQEPVLFTATVLENITYGNEHATMEQVRAAAVSANALDFIEKLPEQFNTRVGEGGIQLSGGQKQRVAIARAVLKDPKVLLLDEATSALDAESERIVQEALDNIMVGRTTIVVAHRLSTVRNADVIAVVSRGKIVEMGSHDALVNRGGSYSSLVRHQTTKSMRRGRSVTNLAA